MRMRRCHLVVLAAMALLAGCTVEPGRRSEPDRPEPSTVVSRPGVPSFAPLPACDTVARLVADKYFASWRAREGKAISRPGERLENSCHVSGRTKRGTSSHDVLVVWLVRMWPDPVRDGSTTLAEKTRHNADELATMACLRAEPTPFSSGYDYAVGCAQKDTSVRHGTALVRSVDVVSAGVRIDRPARPVADTATFAADASRAVAETVMVLM